MKIKLFLIVGIFGLFSCKTVQEPLETVGNVDLQKYAGKWYEIASFPQKFQKGCSCTYAEYTATDKGYISVHNFCYKSEKGQGANITGKAFVVKNSGNSKLKVQFFWPFKGDYWIIELAEDYSYAAVGSPNRKYLWILSREKTIEENIYFSILESLKNKGFDISLLKKTAHSCD